MIDKICSTLLTDDTIITGDIISKYMAMYVEATGSSGVVGSRSNWYFAARIAALNLINFKRKEHIPVVEGFVYAISNPAWKDHMKIGTTVDPYSRLAHFQTYSPFRDYSLDHWSFFSDKFSGEKLIHSTIGFIKDHEWFEISKRDSQSAFQHIKQKSIELLEIQWDRFMLE